MKRIVIVGAGYAGIRAAMTLYRRLRKDDVEITLIGDSEYHTLLTELHEIAGNRSDEGAVLVPLHEIFQYTDVRLVKDRVTSVKPEEKKVVSAKAEYPYDYLVLAAGSRPAYFNIEGMEQYAFPLWSLDDAKKIRDHIREMFALAATEKDPDIKREMLTFVVGGGGFTGVETVGEIARWKRTLAFEHGVDESLVKLILVEAVDKILTVLPERLTSVSMAHLSRIGVEVKLKSPITGVTASSVAIKDQAPIKTRTMIWCGGVQGAELSNHTGISDARRGRLPVNEYQETQYPGVYAAGDQANGQPALVEAALQTAETAAHNIIADMKGGRRKAHKPNLHGVMVSIGRWWGVADLMGLRLVGILAIVMKHIVNMHYLWEMCGFELAIKYLHHEFYREELPRPIVEQQFVKRSNLFWLAPLRAYLGYMWFMQGYHKFTGGWWNSVVLKASAVAADAATSASYVEGGEAAASQGMSLIYPHTPGWYAWIVERFVYPNALIAQRSIVLTEMLLGVLFFIGAFTFIAGAISLVLSINFMLSTGVTDYWYLLAGIAVMNGAGWVFGADQIIMPYLMRQWRYMVRNHGIKIWLWS